MKFVRRFLLPSMMLGLIVPLAVQAQQWAGIIDPSRAIDWSTAGVPGGIPSGSWATCTTSACASLATPANVTAANINAAIGSAPAHSVVVLPVGTFTMNTGLVWNHVSYVALRGQGASQTFLVFTAYNGCQGASADICVESSDTNYNYGPSNVANWTAGYAAGATSITLSSVTNLQIGWPLALDQLEDTSDSGDVYICGSSTTCAYTGDPGGGVRTGRSQQQIVTVTSISGSGPYTVGITPGLYMPNWRSSQTPQAWWATGPVFQDGVENLSMDHRASLPPNSVDFFNCLGCWLTGVRNIMGDTGSSETHVQLFQSNRDTIQNSYFYQTAPTATVQYGIEAFASSDSLIQNNIFQAVSAPLPVNAPCSGCVYSYNFDVNNWFGSISGPNTWLNQGEFAHSVIDHVLFEGNLGAGFYSDNSHGTHHFQTVFRSAGNGYQQNDQDLPTGSTIPIQLDAFSRFYNVIGNVWGSPALPHTTYQIVDANPQNVEIYDIGYGDEVANDPNVGRTLMRWGNYDTVTGAVRWCGNSSDLGWTTTCGGTSEVPSGIANYANPVPASTTLPASFYLSAAPSWWGSTPWPAIGPDVTGGNVSICLGGTNKAAYVQSSSQCPSSTLSNVAGHINAIPAMNCYLNLIGGPVLGNDNTLLTFDANVCYGSGSAPAPAPPTNVSIVVQ